MRPFISDAELRAARMAKLEKETALLESRIAERRRDLVKLVEVKKAWEAASLAVRNVVLSFGPMRENERHDLLNQILDEPLVIAAASFNAAPPPDDGVAGVESDDDGDPPDATQPPFTAI